MLTLFWFILLKLLFLDTDSGGSDDDADSGDGDEPDDGPPPGDGDSEDEPEEEEIRDPKAKIKSLTEANARLARKLKKKDAEISHLKAGQTNGDQLRTARLETAFLRAVMASDEPITDVDDAWDLFNLRGFADLVKLSDDGGAEGMDEAFEKLIARYPWLTSADTDADEDEEPPPTTSRTGRHPLKNKDAALAAGRAAMEERFSALRRRR